MHNSVNFADPVRPRGHLVSTVAELALHVINDLRRGAVKRVLPLRFAVRGVGCSFCSQFSYEQLVF